MYLEGEEDDLVAGMEEIGGVTEVGAQVLRSVARGVPIKTAIARAQGSGQAFSRSTRDTERRAPLGFRDDATGASSFALAAAIGATATMRGKVSRVAHVTRLLIVPSAGGAVIDSIKVGDEEQALAAGVPVELYGANALTDPQGDNFSPLESGIDLVVTLRNTTAGAITGTIGVKATCKR